MNFTLNSPQTFPAGTTVKAYPVTNWTQGQLPPAGAPKGASAAEGVVGAAGVELTGLTTGARYFATAEVGGVYRYIRFMPAEKPPTISTKKRSRWGH